MFQFPFPPLSLSFSLSLSVCVAHSIHISFIYFLSISQLFGLPKCTRNPAGKGLHLPPRKVFAWRTFAWHFTLATRLEHFPFNTSCIVLPSGCSLLLLPFGRPRWPLPVRSEQRFPASQLVSLSVSPSLSLSVFVRLFAFVVLCKGFFSMRFP